MGGVQTSGTPVPDTRSFFSGKPQLLKVRPGDSRVQPGLESGRQVVGSSRGSVTAQGTCMGTQQGFEVSKEPPNPGDEWVPSQGLHVCWEVGSAER